MFHYMRETRYINGVKFYVFQNKKPPSNICKILYGKTLCFTKKEWKLIQRVLKGEIKNVSFKDNLDTMHRSNHSDGARRIIPSQFFWFLYDSIIKQYWLYNSFNDRKY